MRKVVPFLLFSSVAFAQVPNPNPFPASFTATLKAETCQNYLETLEKNAPASISIPGKAGAKGCLQSSKEGDGAVKKAFWDMGYDLQVDQFDANGAYYQVWQKVNGKEGYLLQYYWDKVKKVMQVYYLQLNEMTSVMQGSLFRPQNQIPLTFTPASDNLVYNTWSIGQCFDPQEILKKVGNNPKDKTEVLASGCQAFETTRERLLDSIYRINAYQTAVYGGKDQFSWLGALKSDPNQVLYLNLQTLPDNPKVMVLAWVSYKVTLDTP
ncbi:hypothetical protein [Deinococcus roseus]|uniref:Uncharacterized protein n=1 Tax=Deinococcus roseus TaxID=392414 RepID=A0ABQ2CV21_9DEIO|nr:hypothetical protein [Deinococcus roseus]GGJ22079.1 hypothetical protein GCM10008938_05480 [Deinococcus roseus]